MAGQEVTFAKAIASEHAQLEGDPKTGLTREDIEHDLEAAAARKKRIDEERAAKAGAEVAHVRFPYRGRLVMPELTAILIASNTGEGSSGKEVGV